MAPPKSRYRLAVECIAQRLSEIDATDNSGLDYFKTPSDGNGVGSKAVYTVFKYDDEFLRNTKEQLWFVRPGRQTTNQDTTEEYRGDALFFVLGARRFTPSSEDPEHRTGKDRWEIADEQDRDARKKLASDPCLLCDPSDAIAEDLEIVETFRDPDLKIEGWSVVELLVRVPLSWHKSEP